MAPDALIDQLRAFGSQLRDAAPLARGVLERRRPPGSVVLCGLGGSAAGGRLAAALLEPELRVPVIVPDAPDLPGFVGRDTLVVVTSYSGGTVEALDWFEQAGQAGATRVAIASGGPLCDLAMSSGVPLVRVEAGYAPRGALGLLLAPLLVLLEESGAGPEVDELIERGASAADAVWQTLEPAARDAAAALAGQPAFLVGARALAAVAQRTKNQLCENAKVLAFAGTIPEIAHNEVLGWSHRGRLDRPFSSVFLRDPDEEPGLRALADGLEEVARRDGLAVQRWEGIGESPAERAFALLAFGDLVSCQLAVTEGVDPLEMARLGELKRLVREARPGVERLSDDVH